METLSKLILELPDELARALARIAAEQQQTIQQFALERLSSLAGIGHEAKLGSAAAVLQAMNEPPHLTPSDVDELDAAIATGQLPVQICDLFRS